MLYHESADYFEYPKNPYLNQLTKKKQHLKFPTRKNPEIEDISCYWSLPPKSFSFHINLWSIAVTSHELYIFSTS